MGGLASKPKKVTPPPVKEALPPPIEVSGSKESAAAEAKKRRGRKDTILTGELESSQRGSSFLGGN